MRRATVTLLASSSLIAIAACNGDGDSATTSTTAPTTTTTVVPVEDDGILRLGLLAPLSGPGAEIGASIRSATELAVDLINEAGGIGGRAVRLIRQDEGDDPATAARALAALNESGVDAIIGPVSNPVTLALLDTAIGNGTMVCSPTAAALTLDRFPDHNMFFRTVPSDSMVAEAMARAIDQTGRARVGILYIDDAYGQPFAEALTNGLEARSLSVAVSVPFSDSDTDWNEEISQVASSGAEVVAVIGEASLGPAVVLSVLDSNIDRTTPVFVNDAMRGRATAGAFVGLSDDDLERIIGVGQRAIPDLAFLDQLHLYDPSSPTYFATNAFDCVNLIALSAKASGSTRSETIASRMQSTSTGGTSCASFAACEELLDTGRNVDYDGPSGLTRLGGNGDTSRGAFDLFGFDMFGNETALGSITVAP